MLVDDILTGAGLTENETYKEVRFIHPPKVTYAVWFDDITYRGADDIDLLAEHDVTIELYEYVPDPDVEKAIEAKFNESGQEYIKESRYWLESEQLYQVIYKFQYLTKI